VHRSCLVRQAATRVVRVSSCLAVASLIGMGVQWATVVDAMAQPPSTTISNLPSSGKVGGSFTPTVTTPLSGTTTVSSSTPLVCDLISGVVQYLAQGTCTLVSHVLNGSISKLADLSSWPADVAISPSGQIYVAEQDTNNGVYRFESDGSNPTLVVGGLGQPSAVSFDPAGNLFIADTLKNRIVEVLVDGSQKIIDPRIAGRPLAIPQGVAAGADGTIYVADTGNNQIVKLTLDGSGGYSASVLGTAVTAVNKLALDGQGHLYMLSPPNNSVLQINTDGTSQHVIASNFVNPLGLAEGNCSQEVDRSQGFRTPPSMPNWYFCDEILNTGSLVARLLTRTLRTMFKVEPEDTVSLEVSPAPRGPRPPERVRLQDQSVGEGRRTVYAHRSEDHALAIDGSHTNPGGLLETYSWTEYVDARYVPQLLYLLGGREEDDLFAVLKDRYEDRYDDFKKILVDSGIVTDLHVD
jgi:SMP-30/Gluconolactonase/LRE-like region